MKTLPTLLLSCGFASILSGCSNSETAPSETTGSQAAAMEICEAFVATVQIGTATRNQIVNAIHAELDEGLDFKTSYVIDEFAMRNGFAYVSGEVFRVGSNGELLTIDEDDLEGTPYEDLAGDEGLPFQALLESYGDTWKITSYESWSDGGVTLWTAHVGEHDEDLESEWIEATEAPDSIFAGCQNFALGGVERKGVINALRAVVKPTMNGQPLTFLVGHIAADQGFAFIEAELADGDGAVLSIEDGDFDGTSWEDDIEDGLVTENVLYALVEKQGSTWKTLEWSFGEDDAEVWSDWPYEQGAPDWLFSGYSAY